MLSVLAFYSSQQFFRLCFNMSIPHERPAVSHLALEINVTVKHAAQCSSFPGMFVASLR